MRRSWIAYEPTVVVFMDIGLTRLINRLSTRVPDQKTNGPIRDEPIHHTVETAASAWPCKSSSASQKYHAYAVDLARNVKDLPDYLALMSPALGVWELGGAPAADGENH